MIFSKHKLIGLTLSAATLILVACGESKEPTKASSSSYNKNVLQATTSNGLSKSDLAWHALNTYGWDCEEVTSKSESTSGGYFFIECTSGKRLRVYLRKGQHPKITNESGGYN